jgi:large subunit ribosomal protein L22
MSDMHTIRARAVGIRQTPRKLGLVAALVRGRTVAEALTILSHTPKRAAKPLVKIITSAKANAVNNSRIKEDGLLITQLQVTAGPRLKRFNPAAHGRAAPYQKRASHVLIEVTGEVKPKKVATEAKATAKKESK